MPTRLTPAPSLPRLGVAAAGGYLLGSLTFGLWMARLTRGLDVREHGSGSTGATNVLRVAGPVAAVTVFALDAGKGSVATALGRRLGGDSGAVVAGVGALAGHSWPLFGGFRGGKSVATACGGLVVLSPRAAVTGFGCGMATLAGTRIMSVGSLVAAGTATAAAAAEATRTRRCAPLAFAAAATALIMVRHAANLGRLSRGEEPQVDLHAVQAP